jgi:hypothetical protein
MRFLNSMMIVCVGALMLLLGCSKPEHNPPADSIPKIPPSKKSMQDFTNRKA